MDAPDNTLESIVELTRQVGLLAEQGQWVRASELNAQRQAQLEAFCATLDPRSTAPATIETLSRVHELNETLITAVQRRQQQVLQELATLSTGRRAVAAYGL